jgi:radical SAM superfamily enzyme with C-terminal helix-hairpin-helix motif
MPKNTRTNRQDKRTTAERSEKVAARFRERLLDRVLPNGKRLRDLTAEELEQLRAHMRSRVTAAGGSAR